MPILSKTASKFGDLGGTYLPKTYLSTPPELHLLPRILYSDLQATVVRFFSLKNNNQDSGSDIELD